MAVVPRALVLVCGARRTLPAAVLQAAALAPRFEARVRATSPDKTSYALQISLNVSAARSSSGFLSGCHRRANLR